MLKKKYFFDREIAERILLFLVETSLMHTVKNSVNILGVKLPL